MHRLSFVTFLALPLLTACTSSFIDLRETLAVHRSSFEEKLAGDAVKREQFRACIQQAHDGNSLPLSMATHPAPTQTTISPVTIGGRLRAPVQTLAERIHGQAGSDSASLRILADLAEEFAEPAHRRVDLTKLRLLTDAIQHRHTHVDLDEDALAQDTSLFARLLLAYNRAYFGDLKFAASPDASGGPMQGVVQITSRGFVDRSGTTFRFPGLTASAQIDATHSIELAASPINSGRISADLTRLFLEAFFDAAFRVPAVQQATALQTATPATPYPAFDASRSPVSPDELAAVTRQALRTEAVVTALVGKAVRGGSVFSTNNETVAATLETAAGIFAKKLIEHEGFCYFQITPHP